MLADMPASDHAREDIHKQSNIDEVSFETDVGNIAHPDLITSEDVKVFKVIAPRMSIVNGVHGLTDTFNGNREVGGFHQSGNTFIPYGVSATHQQLPDTPISISRIPQR